MAQLLKFFLALIFLFLELEPVYANSDESSRHGDADSGSAAVDSQKTPVERLDKSIKDSGDKAATAMSETLDKIQNFKFTALTSESLDQLESFVDEGESKTALNESETAEIKSMIQDARARLNNATNPAGENALVTSRPNADFGSGRSPGQSFSQKVGAQVAQFQSSITLSSGKGSSDYSAVKESPMAPPLPARVSVNNVPTPSPVRSYSVPTALINRAPPSLVIESSAPLASPEPSAPFSAPVLFPSQATAANSAASSDQFWTTSKTNDSGTTASKRPEATTALPQPPAGVAAVESNTAIPSPAPFIETYTPEPEKPSIIAFVSSDPVDSAPAAVPSVTFLEKYNNLEDTTKSEEEDRSVSERALPPADSNDLAYAAPAIKTASASAWDSESPTPIAASRRSSELSFMIGFSETGFTQ